MDREEEKRRHRKTLEEVEKAGQTQRILSQRRFSYLVSSVKKKKMNLAIFPGICKSIVVLDIFF